MKECEESYDFKKDFKKILQKPEYHFLKEHPKLGKHIMYLCLGGSYSYGTNNEQSDLDVRGVILNTREELIGLSSYEQYTDQDTDTVIYTFQKMVQLLMNMNPNVCEMLGVKQEHILHQSVAGEELRENRKLFLSKRAIRSFGGYASQQLRRLENALARDNYPQAEKERHILESVQRAMYEIQSRYQQFEEGSIHLYLDNAVNLGFQKEIFMDVQLNHYPLRDYRNIWQEMNSIVKEYNHLGKRNKKKDDMHLNKHAMHLLRLYMMAIDILEKEEINTYREQERDLLLSVRNGAFQKPDGGFRQEFYEMLSDYEKRMEYAAKHTNLPDKPMEKEIEEFVMDVNERVILGKFKENSLKL